LSSVFSIGADFYSVPLLAPGMANKRGLIPAPNFGGGMKSNVSDHLKFMHCIYIDACMKCGADVSELRDLKTIKSRVENEGISFLTITLPKFCQAFERSLELGYIDSTAFDGFSKTGSIPAFLQGMISHVFDLETGRYIDDKTISAADKSVFIESIRQICLVFKKIEIACTPEREQASICSFIEIEHSLQSFSLRQEDTDSFESVSSVLWHNLISSFELKDCIPRHGPGATSEGISGNQKYSWREWADRLEPYFPLVDNGFPLGIPESSKELEQVTILSTENERPVRVVQVPKTLKSPRTIAIEPCCMQFAQQGIRDVLYKGIESYWLTRGHVNFRDQSINQEIALASSKDGRLATIDLSDASDRVPRTLALSMFRSNPDFRDAIDACRSNSAQLPNGDVISPLFKFASMGSALCFPIEAMYFYTVCVVALLRAHSLPATPRNVYKVTRDCYVYGDDIIVPTDDASIVLDYLRKYNCKVNANKTFVSGSFRESCGTDAFAGYEVTPTYLRQLRPENKRQAKQIVSWSKTANLFYLKGYWRTASFMWKNIERIIGPLPYVSERSPVLGRISFLGYQSAERWNDDLHAFEIKGMIPSPVYCTSKLEGYAALFKSFEGLQRLEFTRDFGCPRDALHLERYALHGAVVLKRRWAPAQY
jgi:hypothetical protein